MQTSLVLTSRGQTCAVLLSVGHDSYWQICQVQSCGRQT
jgi:hypothetical protein